MSWGWSTKSSTERGYGREWQKKRKLVLRRDKELCQPCLRKGFVTRATEVDHVIGKAEGKRRRISVLQIESLLNLQSICKACHKLKTDIENGKGEPRPVTGADGWPI